MEKFTKEVYQELLKAVDALPKEAVESASKAVTRKGYDTTGYQYQFLVNVLNEVVSPAGWSNDYEVSKEIEGKYRSGQIYYDVTVDMTVKILDAERKCAGGHQSASYADAKKGAITNALKKTLGLFGVGKKAYEGTLDEDYRQAEEVSYKTVPVKERSTKNEIVALCQKIDTTIDVADIVDFIKEKTQLDPKDKTNHDEIINRLKAITNEK